MTTKILMDYTIARIDHWRCDQPAGKFGLSTYVWVPKTMTQEEMEALCVQAQKAYFKAEDDLKKLSPALPPGYQPNYEKYPNKTVAEVKAIHEAEVAEWSKRNEVVKASQRSFTQILKDISDGTVLSFWDVEFPIDVRLHWGHKHGVNIDYGETKITNPSPNNLDEPNEDEL